MMNRGGQAFSGWLETESWFPGATAIDRARLVASMLGVSTEMIDRWISADATPGEDEREAIGRLSEGAVTGAMWDEPVGIDDGDGDDVASFLRSCRGLKIGMPPTPPAVIHPALLCELGGPIGSLPSGPPFRSITDPVHPGLFVLAGPGVAIVLDETLGWAMREALTIGLQDVRAAAHPSTSGQIIG